MRNKINKYAQYTMIFIIFIFLFSQFELSCLKLFTIIFVADPDMAWGFKFILYEAVLGFLGASGKVYGMRDSGENDLYGRKSAVIFNCWIVGAPS
jgi:hypothetical protein